MLGVDEGGHAAGLLGLSDGVQRHGRLAAGLGAVDLDDPAARQPLAAEGDVQAQGAGADAGHVGDGVLAELHDGAFAELLFDLGQGVLEFLVVCRVGHANVLVAEW